MAMYVGLDVSLKTTSICVVEADGSLVWEGKADSEPAALVEALLRWRDKIALGIEACPLSEWLHGALVESGSRPCASRPVTRSVERSGLDIVPTSRYAGGMASQTHESKTKLLNAALNVIRAKGYAATTVDDICHAAGVTKGSFFHHFKSKDDLALSTAAYWGEMTEGFFASAPYHQSKDPLERLLGYVDFRGEILRGDLPDYTCLLGTLVQETYATHPDIRAACDKVLSRHVAILTRDIEAAKQLYAPDAPWSPATVGYFIQSVLQGAFIFAKAKQGPEVVRESLAHLRRYLGFLFNRQATPRERKKP
jgi:TetR/AcrR family transcriptional regulator, transcriptional repressor for nem operon